jgi:hypothetical protein
MDQAQSTVPLVLLQHSRGILYNWDPALIDALASTRQVVTFDNAGVGCSTGTAPDTIEQMASDAIVSTRHSMREPPPTANRRGDAEANLPAPGGEPGGLVGLLTLRHPARLTGVVRPSQRQHPLRGVRRR